MPDVQPKNLHQLCYAITSIWTKFSEKCFQHRVVSVWSQINKMDKEKFQRAVDKKVAGSLNLLQSIVWWNNSQCDEFYGKWSKS